MASSNKSATQRQIRRSREQWRELVGRFEASGQTREDFCAEMGIGESTLRRWCSRLRERPPKASTGAAVFVELPAEAKGTDALVPPWEVELQLDAGVVLRLRRVPC
jgi:transposase-like protein